MTGTDHDLARTLATRAGELLLTVRSRDFADAAARKAAGDGESHRWLAEQLGALRPGDAVLSEEAADDPARLTADRVWIVDPLDGTREFSELERTDWAVHVALWERGELVAGAVALPAEGTTLGTSAVEPPPARPDGPLRLAVSRSRPPALVADLVAQLAAEPVAMGSAGVKAMSVVRGATDAYVHGGGQYEWDSAAPVAVARVAGLHTSRLDGSPLRYNRPDPYLPDLLICRPEFADQLLAALADAAGGDRS
ncbi:3'(2'),5'-bisphosphate nucleotidase CysQ [Modestobacter sp. VKM Ac-2979]|uniref:3'(2'),5'-bisphosphate nucleotidase CysQ n=1 Tax=unclassified Modestobacter TaxID=2643866 RepID=UPI0022AB815F|nr:MULTISPECIES: 3'(2'),5'-bisphosphate nucleotidase CysQ [unclassified Modestobacter]MCZ2813442.1 3'(2'),5'-bisphosphate nucleotidase CysQ [Modestobacter sp. VKM Ac-2979]MCZ2842366.1 3'(2'),5'-bisphosphate nucleotidase CysQ [Modestobacter sp. VKM Ac-2980]